MMNNRDCKDDPVNIGELDLDVSGSRIFVSHYPTFVQQDQNRDEDEVEQLKNRISELEHLVVTSTLNTSPFLDPSSTSLPPHELMQRVSQLESLLAASEFDNQRLEREVELLKVARQQLEVDLYRNIKDRDISIKNLKQDIELLTVRLSKCTTTISSMEEYIHTLPSEQELDDAKQALSKSYLEIDLLQNKVDRLEALLKETQADLLQKEKLHSKALERLEELKPIEEAQNSVLEGVQTETDLMELATIQKTQLLKATKIVKVQRRSICDLETEKSELLLQLSENVNKIALLESIITTNKYEIDEMISRQKSSEIGKQQLEMQVQELNNRLSDNERWISVRKNEMSNLVRLVTEVDFTITDLKKLISFCQNLSSGDEPLLEDVLFLETEDDPENDAALGTVSSGDKVSRDIDDEWILHKLKSVREARHRIKSLRTQVNEIYTDILGMGVQERGCNIT